jgi:hypothetical protein
MIMNKTKRHIHTPNRTEPRPIQEQPQFILFQPQLPSQQVAPPNPMENPHEMKPENVINMINSHVLAPCGASKSL